MIQLLAKILSLGVTIMLASPMVFPLSFLLLGKKVQPKMRTFFLFLGTLVVGVVMAAIGFFIGQVVEPGAGPTVVSAVIDLFLGALFVFFAVKSLASTEKKFKEVDESQPRHFLLRAFGIGAGLEALNFDALFLVITAAKEVSTADVSSLDSLLLLVLIVFFFTAPVTIPLFLALIFPRAISGIFGRVNAFIMKYSKYILFAVFTVFAGLLLYNGIKFFF